MKRIFFACTCLVLTCGLSASTGRETAGGFEPALQGQNANNIDPNLLSMEVTALETLHHFKATPAQLQTIARLAKSTKAKVEKLEPAKAGADYVNALQNLRDALLANDEQAIEKIQEQLGKIAEKNPPHLDNGFDITNAARRQVDGLYKMLTLRQLVLFADSFGDDIPEPVDMILRGLEETRKLNGKEWEEARDALADATSWLVVGLGSSKAGNIRSNLSAFLNREHGKAAEEKALRPRIRQIIGAPEPLDVLRNLLKHDLALLLSNPRLEEAVQERLNSKK